MTGNPDDTAKVRARAFRRPRALPDDYAAEQAARCAELRGKGHELTPLDLAALHTADGIELTHRNGGTAIHASLCDEPGGTARVYTDRERLTFPETGLANRRDRIIPAGGDVEDHGGIGDIPTLTTETALIRHELVCPRRDRLWRTVLDIMRLGDVLDVRWRLSTSDVVRQDAGYHLDEVWLSIARRRRMMYFLLARGTTDAYNDLDQDRTVRVID